MATKRLLIMSYPDNELEHGYRQTSVICKALKTHPKGDRIVVDVLPWENNNVDWKSYDLVLPIEAWGYPRRLKEFRELLERLTTDKVYVLNHPSLLLWSSDKRYLATLEQHGIPIVPSIFVDTEKELCLSAQQRDTLEQWSKSYSEIVIKPTVGSSADGLIRMEIGEFLANPTQALQAGLQSRPSPYGTLIIQPFLPEICEDGEYSIILFNGKFSHSVIKRPQKGDYRVQKMYGGTMESTEVPDTEISHIQRVLNTCLQLIANKEHAEEEVRASPLMNNLSLEELKQNNLYARIDYVRLRDANGKITPHLIEVEVLEPDLFLLASPESKALGDFSELLIERLKV